MKEQEYLKGDCILLNGWGNYEQLLGKTKEFIAALIKISDKFENYTIIADT